MTFKEIIQRHIIYKCVVLATLLACTILYLHVIISPYLRLLLVWGIAIVIIDFFKGRRIFRARNIYVLLAFAGCYIVSILVCGGEYLVPNLKAAAYMVVGFLTFFASAYDNDKELVKREIVFLGKFLLVLLFIISTICLATYFCGFHYRYTIPDFPGFGYVGITDDRLGGLFSPNLGGALYAISAILAFMFIIKGKSEKVGKGFYALCIADLCVSFACLSASESRTSIFALAITLGGLVFSMISGNKAKKILSGILVLFATIVISFTMVFGLLVVKNAVYGATGGIDIFPESEEYASQEVNVSDNKFVEAITRIASIAGLPPDSDKSDLYKKINELLSGRLLLWEKGTEAFGDHPIFGITNEAIASDVTNRLPDTKFSWTLEGGGLHSIYLTVPVASGIIGTLVLLYFAYKEVRHFYAAHKKGKLPCPEQLGTIAIVVFMLICDAFETRILFRMDIWFALFWLALGYATYLAEEDK